jgi:hypothetical protein
MLEELLGRVDLTPVAAAGDWRERLIQVLFSGTHIRFGEPGLAQSALVTRPNGPLPQPGRGEALVGFSVLINGIASTPRSQPRPSRTEHRSARAGGRAEGPGIGHPMTLLLRQPLDHDH